MADVVIETIRAPGYEMTDEMIILLTNQIRRENNPMGQSTKRANQMIQELVRLEAATITYRAIVPIGHPILETIKNQ